MSSTTFDNSWILSCSAVMMAMVPGLCLFYSSLTNKKNQLTTISQTFLAFSMGCITWALISYSLANGSKTIAKGFIGDCTYCGMRSISLSFNPIDGTTVSASATFAYSLVLAGIAPMIFVSELVGRVRLAFILLFTIGYSIIIYAPVYYWVRSKDGWLYGLDIVDSYGGYYVHLTSGFTALASSVYLGQGENKIYKKNHMIMLLKMLGSGLAWFGWLGFSGGASIHPN